LLFRKIEDAEVDAQVEKLKASKASESVVADPIKETIQFDDFTKMDIRTAVILAAEIVPKTSKLLKITLDTGVDKRTVVSGIAEYYKPEEIIGKKVCLLANLAPRTLRGIVSQGMILMAEDIDGKLHFVSSDSCPHAGSTVR